MERLDRCDDCGCAFDPELLREQEGGLEYIFFRCPYCGKAYVASVTDKALRDRIREYTALAEENRRGRLPEKEQCRMQALKGSNLARAKELRKWYLKE